MPDADCLALYLIIPTPQTTSNTARVTERDVTCSAATCATDAEYDAIFTETVRASEITSGTTPTSAALVPLSMTMLAVLLVIVSVF